MDQSRVEAEKGLDSLKMVLVKSEGVAEEGWLQGGLRHHAVEAGVAAGALRGGDDATRTGAWRRSLSPDLDPLTLTPLTFTLTLHPQHKECVTLHTKTMRVLTLPHVCIFKGLGHGM